MVVMTAQALAVPLPTPAKPAQEPAPGRPAALAMGAVRLA